MLTTKRTAKSKIDHRFKPIGYWELVSQILGKEESDWGDEEGLSNYIYSEVASFMDQWQRDDDATERGLADVEDAVRQTVEDNVNKSIAKRRMYAVASAIERGLQVGSQSVPCTIEENEKRFTLTITVNTNSMLMLWAQAVEGVGVATWDHSLRVSDIDDAKHLVTILDNAAQVFGASSLRRRYELAMDGFEPDGGSYSELYKVALKANRQWRKKR
jgi:hypothetical protein